MSVWYHYDVTIIGNKREPLAKLFGLESDDINTDNFEISFGRKNMPGMRLGKLIDQNPDLVFIVKESVENSVAWWVQKGDKQILIEDSGDVIVEINKRVLDEYTKKYPYMMEKHREGRPYEWKSFFYDYDKTVAMLDQADQYKEMISPMDQDDLDELEAETYMP